jgi:hypothetical protein
MTGDSWRGLVNGILYMVIFSSGLDDIEADRVARYIGERPFGGMTAGQQRELLSAAVRAPRLAWDIDGALGGRGEDEVRGFLRKVAERLSSAGSGLQPDGPGNGQDGPEVAS